MKPIYTQLPSFWDFDQSLIPFANMQVFMVNKFGHAWFLSLRVRQAFSYLEPWTRLRKVLIFHVLIKKCFKLAIKASKHLEAALFLFSCLNYLKLQFLNVSLYVLCIYKSKGCCLFMAETHVPASRPCLSTSISYQTRFCIYLFL